MKLMQFPIPEIYAGLLQSTYETCLGLPENAASETGLPATECVPIGSLNDCLEITWSNTKVLINYSLQYNMLV